MTRWWYPTLRECPWAQEALARRDRQLAKLHRAIARADALLISGLDTPRTQFEDLEEWCALQYTISGNPAWLHYGNQLQRYKP